MLDFFEWLSSWGHMTKLYKPNKDWQLRQKGYFSRVETVKGHKQTNTPVVTFKVTGSFSLFAWVCVCVSAPLV